MPPKQSRRKKKNMDCEVIDLVGKCTAAGCEAQFFRMSPNSKYGIKSYSYWSEAEEARNRQNKAHRLGLAPAVGKMLIIKHRKTKNSKVINTWFGYETEIAKPVRNGWRNRIWLEQCQDLEQQLIAHNLAGGDFCPRNCGIINGKLVQVDFGPYSYFQSNYWYD